MSELVIRCQDSDKVKLVELAKAIDVTLDNWHGDDDPVVLVESIRFELDGEKFSPQAVADSDDDDGAPLSEDEEADLAK